MTRESWAQEKRTRKEEMLRFEFPQAKAEEISRWADTSFDALPPEVKWGLLIRYPEPEKQHIPTASLSPFEDDRIEWYKAAADTRNHSSKDSDWTEYNKRFDQR